jgi:hypothetical protein
MYISDLHALLFTAIGPWLIEILDIGTVVQIDA